MPAFFQKHQTLNIGGQCIDFSQPKVMGILNVTPDSFFDGSKYAHEKSILQQVEKMLNEGAQIIDVGGYSTRPNAQDVSQTEEIQRVVSTISIILKHFPQSIISIDTFRAEVAKQAIKEGAQLINDVSGGTLDPKMFETVAHLQVPYILMHMKGNPQTMSNLTNYKNLILDITNFFEEQIFRLRQLGVKDIILDIGLGFAKNIEQNYMLLHQLEFLKIFELPVLVGASRKSMIWRKLNHTPDQALNGTTVVNTIALQNGTNILRVHDVKEAKEVVDLLF